MDQALEALVPEDHPILLELASLKSSLSRFQEEAHSVAVKLQRHSLETSRALERAHILERENELFRNELRVLRSTSNTGVLPPSHPANLQIHQLTLSLRELSDRLSETDRILSQRNTELVSTQNELLKARVSTTAAYELASRIRAREEEEKARVRELQLKAKAAEEAASMSDKAMTEYADLVRSLEAKLNLRHESQTAANDIQDTSKNQAAPIMGSAHLKLFTDERDNAQNSLRQLAMEKEESQKQVSTLQHDLAILNNNLETERTLNVKINLELANLRSQLQKLERDDNTAAKMVSRYMKFSQKSTDALQSTLETVKARYAATIDTLQEQLHSLATQYHNSEASNERLRQILDTLGGEMLKESYGRRREITLRIKVVNREERLLEALRRWSRRAEEALRNLDENDASYQYLHNMVQDARILMDSLDAPPTNSHSAYPVSGSLARLINVQSAIDDLVRNVQNEQSRRLHLQELLIQQESTSRRTVNKGTSPPTPPLASSQAPTMLGTQEPSKPILPSVGLLSGVPKFSFATSDPDIGLDISPLVLLPALNVEEVSEATEHEDILTEALTTGNGVPDVRGQTSDSLVRGLLPSDTSYHERVIAPGPSDHQERNSLQIKIAEDVSLVPDVISSHAETIVDSASNSALVRTGAEPIQVVSSKQNQQESNKYGSILEPANTTSVVASNTFTALSFIDKMDGQLPLEIESPTSKQGTETHVLRESSPIQSSFIASSKEDDHIHTSIIGFTSGNTVTSSEPTTLDPQQSTLVSLDDLHLPIRTIEPQTPELSPVDVGDYKVGEGQPRPTLAPLILASSETNARDSTLVSHPLLEGLKEISKRYDDLQRAFHDCHVALETLKASLSAQAPTNQGPVNYASLPSSLSPTTNSLIPSDIIRAALSRLDDFAEDARVELEIRVSDEELLARGYETLLSIPGALTSNPSMAETPYEDSIPNQHDLINEIEAFVSGAEPTIEKARNGFGKKLDDLQHDIAVLKRAIHDADISSSDTPPTTAPSSNGWTSWIRTPSRSASPLPGSGAALTFGNVITNPQLRRYPSAFNLSRKSSFNGIGSRSIAEDPLSTLGLRIPMPRFEPLLKSSSSLQTGGPSHSPTATPRSRTISTMYMIGLGMQSPGTAFSPTIPSPQRRVVSAAPAPGTGTYDYRDDDSDVE